jgi:hypothetical protein
MANSSLHADDTYVLKVLDFLIGLFLVCTRRLLWIVLD